MGLFLGSSISIEDDSSSDDQQSNTSRLSQRPSPVTGFSNEFLYYNNSFYLFSDTK